jgi:hypothetical protein
MRTWQEADDVTCTGHVAHSNRGKKKRRKENRIRTIVQFSSLTQSSHVILARDVHSTPKMIDGKLNALQGMMFHMHQGPIWQNNLSFELRNGNDKRRFPDGI